MNTNGAGFARAGFFTLGVAAALAAAGAEVEGNVFTFAGVTFDQRNTPNKVTLLGNGAVLGGAAFSPGLPEDVTEDIFFAGAPGLRRQYSLGVLSGLHTNGLRALNLPLGNNGVNTRHGIELSFTNGVGMPNRRGADMVVFESASSESAVEGLMVRVLAAQPAERWSGWFYRAPSGFGCTIAPSGAHAYVYDFSELGVPEDAVIERIQIANLTETDRVRGAGTDNGQGLLVGEGPVVFDGSSPVRPDASSRDKDRVFDAKSLDPDPLFAFGLHSLAEVKGRKEAQAISNPGQGVVP